MIKAQIPQIFQKISEIFPKNPKISGKSLKTLNICRRTSPGFAIAGQGYFPNKFSQGDILAIPLANL